ncbi:Hypothetical_protein [Hexamita inflata]|uniref:Hypothetical_protein n=1 Tax=Hexamita inflata TaxID=28002 RepID=A0AA86N6X0_9EUKA|nr:Hypothetical protein HINF_LOCUS1508 [Hexamita inflata]
MYQKPEISLDFRNTKNTFIRYSKLNDQKCSQREFINSSNDTSIRIGIFEDMLQFINGSVVLELLRFPMNNAYAISMERYSSTQVVASIIYSELKTKLGNLF